MMSKKFTKISAFLVLISTLALYGSFCFGNVASAGSKDVGMNMKDMSPMHLSHDMAIDTVDAFGSQEPIQTSVMPCCYENKNFPIQSSTTEGKIGTELQKPISFVFSANSDILAKSFDTSVFFNNDQITPPPEVALASVFKKE